jgi:MoxR-like ATPase
MVVDTKQFDELVTEKSSLLNVIRKELSDIVVGYETFLDRVILAIMCNQHILVEGALGLAKTQILTSLAKAMRISFKRIRFKPDIHPSDFLGTIIYDPIIEDFSKKEGLLIANIILADEIDQASAIVQNALLNAITEHHISIDDESTKLEEPFIVVATHDPAKKMKNHSLQESQENRFMMKLKIAYPTKEEEQHNLKRLTHFSPQLDVKFILNKEKIRELQELTNEIFLDEQTEEYIVNIVDATCKPEVDNMSVQNMVQYGTLPQATMFLNMASKAHALIQGRWYVIPEDVKAVGMDVLRHRAIITYEEDTGEKKPEELLKMTIDSVSIP